MNDPADELVAGKAQIHFHGRQRSGPASRRRPRQRTREEAAGGRRSSRPVDRRSRRRAGVAQRLAFGRGQVARRRMLLRLLPGRDHLARARTEGAIRATRVEALRRQRELYAPAVLGRESQRGFRRFRGRRLRRFGRWRRRRLDLRRRRGSEGDVGAGRRRQNDAGAERQPAAARAWIDARPRARSVGCAAAAPSPAWARYRRARSPSSVRQAAMLGGRCSKGSDRPASIPSRSRTSKPCGAAPASDW